jgi:hypothetical protein
VTADDRRALTVDQATVLAGDLIRALAENIGDLEAIDALMLRWANTLGASNLARVSLAAAQTLFADCLTYRTPDAWPAEGGHELTLSGDNT